MSSIILLFFLLFNLSWSYVFKLEESFLKCKITINGAEYAGETAVAENRQLCLPWTYRHTNGDILNEMNFPEGNITAAANFCRNPNNRIGGPWCYTELNKFQFCDVKRCEMDWDDCKDSELGQEYNGKISNTKDNETCQEWSSQSPHKHKYNSEYHRYSKNLRHNYCRNPDKTPGGPWCYTTNPAKRWKSCEIPKCIKSRSSARYVNGMDHITGAVHESKIINSNEIYSNAKVVMRLKISVWSTAIVRKLHVWSTSYTFECQRDLNEFHYCSKESIKFLPEGSQVIVTFICKSPLNEIIAYNPLTDWDYAADITYGDVYRINGSVDEDYRKYETKVKQLYKKRADKAALSYKAIYKGSSYFLLKTNAVPVIISNANEIIGVVSEIGRGKIGFINDENGISNEVTKNYFTLVYDLVHGENPGKIYTVDGMLIKMIWNDRASRNHKYPPFVWNSHNVLGEDKIEILINMIKDGLNLVVGLKPWAYNYYIKKFQYSELKPLLIEAGIWPKVGYASKVYEEAREFDPKLLPLQLLTQYAFKDQSSLAEVGDMINLMLVEIPFPDISNKLNKEVQTFLKSFYDKYLPFIQKYLPCVFQKNKIPTEKMILKLYNTILINANGNKLPLASKNIYPGTGKLNPNKPKSFRLQIHLLFNDEVYYTNTYLYPSTEMKIQVNSQKSKFCDLYLNHHLDDTTRKGDWYKLPVNKKMYKIKTNIKHTIFFAFGGIISLRCTENDDNVEIIVENVYKIPYYDRRNTLEQRRNWSNEETMKSPWAILACDGAVFVVPIMAIRNLFDAEPSMFVWDIIFGEIFHLRGKDLTKSRREIIATDSQISAGYMHNGYPVATQYYYVGDPVFKDDYYFDVDNIRRLGRWGVAHEVGHNMQMDIFMFYCTRDITNNIFSVIADEKVTGLDSWTPGVGWFLPSYLPRMINHIKNGTFQKTWCSNYFVGLGTYIQLRNVFGWELYRQLFRRYKLLAKRDDLKNLDDNGKMQLLMLEMSNITGQNLLPHFDLWRWPITPTTKNALGNLEPFLPDDHLTKLVEPQVQQIVMKYKGLTRKPKNIVEIVGPLTQYWKVKGKPYLISNEEI